MWPVDEQRFENVGHRLSAAFSVQEAVPRLRSAGKVIVRGNGTPQHVRLGTLDTIRLQCKLDLRVFLLILTYERELSFIIAGPFEVLQFYVYSLSHERVSSQHALLTSSNV
jgi:hypothetical protein